MATIVTRAGKGSPLSFAEGDANFTNLNTDLVAAEADIVTAQAAADAAQTDIDNHIADTSDAHDASAISVVDTVGAYSGSDVEAVLDEVADRIGATNSSSIGFRNRIINGDMRISQRVGTTATAVVDGTYYLDRWLCFDNDTGAWTVQQATATPPEGFTHYMRCTVTTADASLAAGDRYLFEQKIEGYNVGDLDFGKSTAKTVTLSFLVRSSVTGTFSGSLINSAGNRSYPFTYTISSANTWEQKSITMAGDTSGTWLADNGIGLGVFFSLGSGSTYKGTAGAWAAATYFAATGETALIGTLNATFDITGVQLEAGAVATPFERRPYGLELSLCQRYYWKWQIGNAVSPFAIGWVETTSSAHGYVPFKVPMRTSPTLATTGTAGDYTLTSTPGGNAACTVAPTLLGSICDPHGASIAYTSAAVHTAGQACMLRCSGANGYLAFSAEL